VPLAVGLLLLIRARTPGRDRASLIDAAIIATGLGLLSWVFLMKPAATDSSLTVVGRIIAIAYPAADVLLLGQAWGRSGIDAAAIGIGSIALFLLVVARMAGLIRQVEHQAAQLEQLAERDPLTGAANRRAWDRALPVEMDRARRAGTPLAVALLDLDHFKGFNDPARRTRRPGPLPGQTGRTQPGAGGPGHTGHQPGAPGPGSHGAAG
jgi:predicted signal transduction protein with EAL and GGDEF domain